MKTRLQLTTISLLISILFSNIISAQQGINYQGVARNIDGQLMVNEDLNLKFNIRIGNPDGDDVYTETHTTITDVSGVFSIVIGQGIPSLNTFEDINWAEDKHFLNVVMNGEDIGTTEFMATPYTKAIGKWQAQGSGLVTKGTGGSIYLGENSGQNDDFSNNHNIGLGDLTLATNSTGNANVAIGEQALSLNRSGSYNVAIGSVALNENVTGDRNVAIGRSALQSLTIGRNNLAIGFEALQNNIQGVGNIAFGSNTLKFNIANTNIALGSSALYANANANGNSNIAIGGVAGQWSDGSHNIFIGPLSGHSSTGDFKLHINSSNSPDSFPLIYGEFDNKILAFDANKIGIGTQTPLVPLQIVRGSDVDLSLESGVVVLGDVTETNLALDNNEIQARNGGLASDLYLQSEGGNVRIGGSIVQASDKRLKRDIEDISHGLKEILNLRPTQYFWKGIEQEYKSLGLIAQEVEGVVKNVVTYDEEQDKYGVSYTELIPVLIKAIQEQNLIIKMQQKRNNRQSRDLLDIKSKLETIEIYLTKLDMSEF